MSTPRPTETDVEALVPIEECIDPADLMEAMVHAGAWAVIEATTDTADREPSRELYEQTAADVRKWLAARDAAHQWGVEALRAERDSARQRYAALHAEWGREIDHCEAARARAEAAERALADRDAAIKALAGEIEASGCHHGHQQGDTDECNACTASDFRALLPTEDDQ